MTTCSANEALNRRSRWVIASAAFLAPLLLLAAALSYPPIAQWVREIDKVPIYGRDVSDQDWHGSFSLLDVGGNRRDLGQFGGRAVLVAFGYTHCPDACPTTLMRLAKVRQLLGAQAEKVQVLFITIDPQRDTSELVDNYVHAFDPSFIALRGTEEETAAAARAFHAEFRRIPYGSDVVVEHTVDTFLLDAQGRLRDVLPYDLTAEEVTQDVRIVLGAPNRCWPWSRVFEDGPLNPIAHAAFGLTSV
jgi:protein SCO1/2